MTKPKWSVEHDGEGAPGLVFTYFHKDMRRYEFYIYNDRFVNKNCTKTLDGIAKTLNDAGFVPVGFDPNKQ